MKKLLLSLFILGSFTGFCQDDTYPSSRWGGTFSAGYFNIHPGKRFESTSAGWHIDVVGRYAISTKAWLGVGLLWGASPEVSAPEYQVFAPLDHPIWFETSQYFVELRFDPSKGSSKIIQLYLSGRLGWSTEFSEYSGPTVRRSGLLVSGIGGVSINVLRKVSIDTSLIYSLVNLGDAKVFDVRVDNTSVGGSFFGLRGGIDLWF